MQIFDTKATPWRTRILVGAAMLIVVVLMKWLFW